jgi:hypothetical protein
MAEENISDKIENWLREEEFQYNKVHDPNAGTNITFWSNPELKMHDIVMRDKLTIAVGSLLSVESKSKTKDIHKTITIREA